MKKLILIMTLFALSLPAMADTHTVVRGENLQSIAAKYNITESQLIEANPGTDKLFYVGLKLTIPQSSQTALESVATQSIQNEKPADLVPTASHDNENIVTDDKPDVAFSMMLEYGFLSKEKGVKGSNYTYAFTIGGNYYFMHRMSGVFAGARIGYNSANYNSYQHVRDGHTSATSISTSTSHFITLPINAGYSFATPNRNLALTPYAGIDFNFCVGGKSKTKMYLNGSSFENEGEFKKKVGLDARLGLQLRLWGINLGAAYVIPLNKNQKRYFGDDSYVTINLGYGF